MSFAFEKLLVYQRAVDLADQITSLTEPFPKGYRFLTDQLNRASLSVAANTVEHNERRPTFPSPFLFRHFALIYKSIDNSFRKDEIHD